MLLILKDSWCGRAMQRTTGTNFNQLCGECYIHLDRTISGTIFSTKKRWQLQRNCIFITINISNRIQASPWSSLLKENSENIVRRYGLVEGVHAKPCKENISINVLNVAVKLLHQCRGYFVVNLYIYVPFQTEGPWNNITKIKS